MFFFFPHGRWKLLSQHSCETSAGKALQQRGEHACGVRLTPQGWSRRLTPSCTRCRRSPVAVDVFDDAVFHGARIESDQPKQGRGGLLKILSDNLPRAAGDAFLYHRPCVRAFNPVPRAAPHLSMLISHTLTVCGTLVRGKLSRIFSSTSRGLPGGWSGCSNPLPDSMHARTCSGVAAARCGRGIQIEKWEDGIFPHSTPSGK